MPLKTKDRIHSHVDNKIIYSYSYCRESQNDFTSCHSHWNRQKHHSYVSEYEEWGWRLSYSDRGRKAVEKVIKIEVQIPNNFTIHERGKDSRRHRRKKRGTFGKGEENFPKLMMNDEDFGKFWNFSFLSAERLTGIWIFYQWSSNFCLGRNFSEYHFFLPFVMILPPYHWNHIMSLK